MSTEKFLILDNGTIQTLFRAAGTMGWDLLFADGLGRAYPGIKILIPQDIIAELGRGPSDVKEAFENWLSTQPASKVVVPNFTFDPSLLPPDGDLGDHAIRALMKGDLSDADAAMRAIAPGGAEFRLLTDDMKFVSQLAKEVKDAGGGLGVYRMFDTPYYSTGEFLFQRFQAGDISGSQLESFLENVKSSDRFSSIRKKELQVDWNRERHALSPRDLFFTDEMDLEKIVKIIGDRKGTASVKFALGAAVAGAVIAAKKFGIIGDALAFGATVAEAAELREKGDVHGANKIWVKYLFETAGTIPGGIIGVVAHSALLKGLGGPIAAILSGVAGGIASGYGGAQAGGLVYDAFPKLFDTYLNKIYDYAEQFKATMSEPEALATAALKTLGFDATATEGGPQADLLLATLHSALRGNGGDDILLGLKPEHVAAGAFINPDDPESERASQELRMVLDGGAGDDWVVALGGTGVITIGGEGKDFLYNTSYKGQLYGDTIDGTGGRSRDVFWWSPGAFVMDAGPEDSLQFFGLPLTGGTGVKHETGEQWAYDWVLPFIRYGLSDSGQLIVQSWIDNAVNHIVRPPGNDDILSNSMIVENFDQGAGGNWAHIAQGDLGMTFRILDFSVKNAMSAFESVWGMLINRLDAVNEYGKQLHWVSADDPLVLDLDGDGIETTERDFEGVHFDFNGDHFAELSGWTGADDGFLVLDRDGNGKIDDISELFGAPGGSGFAELRLIDEDANGLADGRIDANDVVFSHLQVWRDLNQDGVSQQGELFSLADLGIASINTVGEGLNVTTPSGALLREKASFTRADGSTGNIFEAVFETDPIDTVFTGDRGTAGWAARGADGAVIDDKGFGLLGDLSVALSNNLALNETVKAAAASMTTPDLAVLRQQVEPVLGAWATSLSGTRELTPLLLSADGGTVVDRAVWIEDAQGGYFALASGAALYDAQGAAIARPQDRRRRKTKAGYGNRRRTVRALAEHETHVKSTH